MSFSEGDFSQIIFHCCNHFANHKHKTMYSYTLTLNLSPNLATFGKTSSNLATKNKSP